MKRNFLFFFLGICFAGGLFQFDINLPSFHAKQFLKQKTKISKTKTAIRKQRASLSTKSFKKASKKAAGSLLPLVGAIISLGLAAEDYCEDLENNIELQNILNDYKEEFNLSECIKEVKKDLENIVS